MVEGTYETYTAVPCPCKQKGCWHWHVANVAHVQGVRFTEEQAVAVAKLLNKMAKSWARGIIQSKRDLDDPQSSA